MLRAHCASWGEGGDFLYPSVTTTNIFPITFTLLSRFLFLISELSTSSCHLHLLHKWLQDTGHSEKGSASFLFVSNLEFLRIVRVRQNLFFNQDGEQLEISWLWCEIAVWWSFTFSRQDFKVSRALKCHGQWCTNCHCPGPSSFLVDTAENVRHWLSYPDLPCGLILAHRTRGKVKRCFSLIKRNSFLCLRLLLKTQ